MVHRSTAERGCTRRILALPEYDLVPECRLGISQGQSVRFGTVALIVSEGAAGR